MLGGQLITFEGIDGCGKTTQVDLCAEWLTSLGVPVRKLREPGGTSLGEYIRSALLDTSFSDMSPESELLLYLSARAQLTKYTIKPALAHGEVVILDRFIDSTLAYQGYARGLGIDLVSEFNMFATGGLIPDMTVVVDIDPHVAFERITGNPDRLESEGTAFMARVRDGYRTVYNHDPDRILWCHGSQDIDTIHAEVKKEIMRRFGATD